MRLLLPAGLLLLALLPTVGRCAVVTESTSDGPGEELLGTLPPPWTGLTWVQGGVGPLADLRGRVVLVRWWTDTCPYCAASAPALNRLHADFSEKGLTVVGVYHPKPPRPVDRDALSDTVRLYGFRFPVAVDQDWSVLRKWWLSGGGRRATSVSFLLDRTGRIRLIHPGPVFSIEGPQAAVDDYRAIRSTIEALLEGDSSPSAE